jgi:hypothetical protein
MSAEMINLRARKKAAARAACKPSARTVKSSTTWFPPSGSYVGGEDDAALLTRIYEDLNPDRRDQLVKLGDELFVAKRFDRGDKQSGN